MSYEMIKSKIVFLFIILGALSVFAGERINIIRSGPGNLVLEWTSPDLEWETIDDGENQVMRPRCGDLPLLYLPNQPVLPVDAFLLKTPENTKIRILDSVSVDVPVSELYHAASPFPESNNSSEQNSTENKNLLVSSFIQFVKTQYRSQNLSRLAVHPLKYFAGQGIVKHLRYIKLELFVPNRENATNENDIVLLKGSGFFKQQNNDTDLLSRQKLKSNVTFTAKADTKPVKLYVVESGVYGVSGHELAAAGVDLFGIQTDNIRIFNKGMEQPCYIFDADDGFDENSTIVFYGERLAGEDQFYQAYTDTNVYWLSWDGPSEKRFVVDPSYATNADTESSFFYTLHLEEDKAYHNGDNDSDIHETEKVSGEDWVWFLHMYPGSTARITFDLPGLASGSDSVRFRIRVRGTTYDPKTPDHHARFVVNNETLYDFYFDDREDKIPAFSAPADLLKKSGNKLEILSIDDTEATLSQFYIDWVECDYQRLFQAQNGQLDFEIDEPPSVTAFLVNDFDSDSLFILDKNEERLVQPEKKGKIWKAEFDVQSAGYLDGNYAYFYMNGGLLSLGKRGVNVVALDSDSGTVIFARNFDTYLASENADTLALMISQLPENSIVLAAVRDEGSRMLNDSAFVALEQIGSSKIRELGSRDSWAIIGQKGALPGTVPEMLQTSGNGMAQVTRSVLFQNGGSSYGVVFADSSLQEKSFSVFDFSSLKKPVVIKDNTSHLAFADNGADYIIVTHEKFYQQAQRLAQYRQAQNGFRTLVADVADIYDEFNYGIKDPQAIKDFVQYAFENWQSPAPKYLVLFGDACLDPKQNMSSTTNIDYVPSYGSPVCDLWFTYFNDDEILPNLNVGRFPVSTAEQGDAVLDKIMDYEATPSDSWKKTFLFITGGFDTFEQTAFKNQSNTIINEYVNAAPTFGKVILISKESQGYKEGEHRQDILDAMNNGVVWTNFIGHAGTRTWDLMFHDPDVEDLYTSPRFPFISSMTCHTGRFAEYNDDSFGEKFFLEPEKGAVAFLGTSGWGYTNEDYLLVKSLFRAALEDTIHTIGDAITKSKIDLWTSYGMVSVAVKQVIMQFALLGDPAMKLAIPEIPDLVINPLDIHISPLVPSESDSQAVVKVKVNNYGLVPTDSVVVALNAKHQQAGNFKIDEIKIPPVGLVDSTNFLWPLKDMAGEVELIATVDPLNNIEEVDENNNEQNYRVNVLSNRIQMLAPPNQAITNGSDIFLKIQNPWEADGIIKNYEFQIDTSLNFSGPLYKSSGNIPANGLFTKWSVNNLLTNRLYFWRCRDVSETTENAWMNGTFYNTQNSLNGWRQQTGVQFQQNSFEFTKADEKGLYLAGRKIAVYVESAGYLDGDFARIIVDETPTIVPYRGHNIVVLDRSTGKVIKTDVFDTWGDSTAANQLAQFINNVEYGNFVFAAIKDEGANRMNEAAYTALESIGSALCREVGLRDSWAIIGRKGAPIGSVPEIKTNAGEGSAAVADTLEFYNLNGTCSSMQVGPTTAWDTFSWEYDLPETGHIQLDILGINKQTGNTDTLASQTAPFETIDLSGISSETYPSLKLYAKMSTTDGRTSPLIKWWQVTFDPVPELVLGLQEFQQDSDSVIVGENVKFSFNMYNLGQTAVQNVDVLFEADDPATGRKTFAQQVIHQNIPVDSFYTVNQSWTADNKTGERQVYITLDPDDKIPEILTSNNSLSAPVTVLADTGNPSLTVTFDGKEIFDGDLVASTPVIIALVKDNSPQRITDTSAVTVLLNGDRLSFSDQTVRILPSNTDEDQGRISITPNLDDGDHTLDIIVADASRNYGTFHGSFRVESTLKLIDVLNYPNPFAEQTSFSFHLTQPAEVRIKIYTIAGRLIKTVEPGWASAGFNSFFWDGLDNDGDRIANGVYLYKVFAKNENEKAEETNKLVVMR